MSGLLATAMVAGYVLLLPLLQSLAAQPLYPQAAQPSSSQVQTVTVIPTGSVVTVVHHTHHARHHARRGVATQTTGSPTITLPATAPATTPPSAGSPSNGFIVVGSSSDSISGNGSAGGNGVCQGAGC